MSNISNKLRRKRQELGISREALGEKCGLSSKTIQRAEEGEDVSEETIEKFEKILKISLKENYTESQKRAITSKSENLLIIAGAGAGKTKTIEARIVHLINQGVKPSEIIAWTFTEKAANELNVRVKKLLKENSKNSGASEMIIGTIHSSCLRLLQECTNKYNGYQVLTPIQNIHFVNRYFDKINIGEIKKISNNSYMQKYRDTLKFINIVNITTENPTDDTKLPKEIKKAILNYKQILKNKKYFDFTTIQEAMLLELNNNNEFRKKIQETFKYVIVDEYQDVNYLQEKIISNIMRLGIKATVVGDADQAIYQFRGSDYNNIISFDKRHKDVEVVTLEDNFRSTDGVVNIAQSVINYNENRREKNMTSVKKGYEFGDITYKRFATEEEENQFIADRIKDLIKIGMNLNEIAILIRKKSLAESLIKVLERNDIQYLVENVNKLLETKEIMACISIFRYLNNELDKKDIINIWLNIGYNINKGNIENAVDSLDDMRPDIWSQNKRYTINQEYLIQEIFYKFFSKLGLKNIEDEKLENLMFNFGKFTQLINDFETINFDMQPEIKIGLFCSFLKYSKDQYPEGYLDNIYAKRDGVKIMTVHKSKGLQFSAVFVPGLTNNIFPIKRLGGETEWHYLPKESIKNYKVIRAEGDNKKESDKKILEDERRLFYVAVTRSRKFLFLTGAKYNNQCVKESTFIAEARDARGFIFEYNSNVYDIAKRNKWSNFDNDDIEILLDFSTLADYYMCPYKFKLSHIYGFVQPINLRMGYGSSIHNIAKEINKLAIKLNDGENLENDDIKEIIEENFHLPYIGVWKDTEKEMLNKATKCIEGYVAKNRKEFKDIEFVEKYIELDLGKNILVSGRIDLVLKKDILGNTFVYIVDYKTDEKANSKIENKIQTNIYSLGYKGVTGSYPHFVEILDIDKNKIISTEPVDAKELGMTIKSIIKAAGDIKENKLIKKCDTYKCKTCHKKMLCLSKDEKTDMGI